MNELKPVLKYLGGKRTLVSKIAEQWEDKQRLVEPCVGGMSVVLGLNPTRALLNDINPYVINLYKQIQIGLKVEITPYINTEEQYYKNRERLNDIIDSGDINTPECAELIYYLNHSSTNGLMRFNKKGHFNAAKGSYDTINYTTDFTQYMSIFGKWEFTCGDFRKIELEPTDFIYADPPYDDTFTKYSRQEFGWYDQVRFANWLAAHTGKVVASNNGTDRIVELYKDLGFNVELIEVPKKICLSGERKPMMEMFAVKETSS
jgi:DNA adenine methylase